MGLPNPKLSSQRLDNYEHKIGANAKSVVMKGFDGSSYPDISVNEDGVVDVSATSLPLPTGAATSAKQDLLLTELEKKADLTETQPVSASTLPLPTGAATSALQTSGNASLTSIDGKFTTLNAKDFSTATLQGTTNTKLDTMITALQLIDNFISGSRGLVTEDNSLNILKANKGLLDLDYTFTRDASDLVTQMTITDGVNTNTMAISRNANGSVTAIGSTIT